MNLKTSLCALIVFSNLFALSTCAFSQSMDEKAEFNAGVQAYRNSKYEDAIVHFKNVVAMDDNNVAGHFFLATAEAQQYIPAGDSTDSDRNGILAIDEYKKVLELDPKSADSAKGIASLYMQMHKFQEAQRYFRRAISIDPNDVGNYYAIGVIAWTDAYQRRMQARSKEKLKPTESFINNPGCGSLRSANETVIKDGMDMLTKSLQLKPDYDDAMAYMNLLYREKADIDCLDNVSYQSDIESADHWVDLAISAKKIKAEAQRQNKRESSGISVEHNPSPALPPPPE